ncbi:MAG: bifunctional acetate--CoA ligase family protein/GNAT family N-acetyltransferase [Chlamydiae bacterium]|nr:bifunctional acetate--CoA ligase family protein/GNAT family N-acetyltransferase [Chlamydiota bacterium]
MPNNIQDTTDPSQNFFTQFPDPLDSLFLAKSIALIGAKDTLPSVGRTMMVNLSNFSGKLYPINPHRQEVMGKKCYPNLQSISEPIDLAIIVTPAKTVPGLVKECVAAGIPSIIIISAGFKELGAPGIALEEEILKTIKGTKTRIIGPNCLGVMNPIYGMNATFAATTALPGQIAFISQSGAMCTAVLDWSLRQKIGFSSFVSIGSMLDINWGDLIDYFGNDPNTNSILIYMESIGNARAFLSAARKVTLTKPVIVIKAGRTEAAAKAAASHTGSLAGSDEIFEVAMQRAGVLRVETIDELFSIALALGKQPVPKGSNLTIITNAGGPSVLATDKAVSEGAQMSTLDPKTIERLNTFLPEAWSHTNPVDILGDASPDRYAQTLEVVSKDPNTDGILVILSPQDMTDPTKTAEVLQKYVHIPEKPVFASWMGGDAVQEGMDILNDVGIPTFSYPDSASQIFGIMCKHRTNLEALYQTPAIRDDISDFSKHQKAEEVLAPIIKEKRTLLSETEAKRILDCYDIPTVQNFITQTSQEAVTAAEKIGYPVVLKLHSETITHKTDVGGVKLNVRNPEGVRQCFDEIKASVTKLAGAEHFQGVAVQKMIVQDAFAFDLILGSSSDPQFGPTILFGSGGALVEIFKDRALALPPLNETLVKQMMKKTNIYEALKGVRGQKPVDLTTLEKLIIRFAQMIVENPRIKECDINPLRVSPTMQIALDARIVLHDFDLPLEKLPKLAIRPYPNEYVTQHTLKTGIQVVLRPIRPEDEPMIVEFHKSLSAETVFSRYRKFLSLDARIAHQRLIKICCIDYDRDIRIVGEYQKQIIGIGRLIQIPGTKNSQFQMLIVDKFHKCGLGTALLKQLIEIARKEKIKKIESAIFQENYGMLEICKKLGFTMKPVENNPSIIHAELAL